jgi:hypothetical protein
MATPVCQLRVIARQIAVSEGVFKRNAVFWADEKNARHYLDQRLVEVVGKDFQAGPSETKPVELFEKKSPLQRKEGWPLNRFSLVERVWSGMTVVCCATGPSITDEQVQRCRAKVDREGRPVRIIVVNDAYRLIPWADINYFADGKWWEWHKDREEFKAFEGARCSVFTTGNMVIDPEVHILRNAEREGLSLDREEICTGSSSGYQAINIAVLAGAERVVLLGYDNKRSEVSGKPHFFGQHPDRTELNYDVVKEQLKRLADAVSKAGVRVTNASLATALTCFERGALESILPDPA